ncbi:hypothetical protein RJ639_020500 [Escallonia herrerae]|uniref:Generative cell specific-1/HAP2 domain-containing protein n=1 Tax=Escallonia herrerae TaxID=1293975 RepID=A0AA88V7I4_9ASTE|nr:hypothetical protein RJ639_020500 [Escallonia herrerae]
MKTLTFTIPVMIIIVSSSLHHSTAGVQILSKSKLEKCEKVSDSGGLNCTAKVVIDLAVPSGSSGREASIVAELVEVEENSTAKMRTLRVPPVITVNKSAAYALYELTYIRDVPFKPEELYVKTRKCEPDAGADVVKICERLRDDKGHIIEHTQEVVMGPENRTAISNDNFLRVNLIGDYVGYTNIPSFDNYYLVIPRRGSPGEPKNLGRNYSMWMLLERVRFTLDGLECNKIGVSYEAFNGQPDFCSSPLWSCLHNQLWNFWDNAGSHSFSIGLTEVLNTNLLIELSADDIEYVYQRSPGKILSINVPTFEALTQFGTATITTKNIGEVEASYSLTEQFYIMKPQEVMPRSFKLYPTTDQAARYLCSAILKDSDFNEVDRAECQFTTTATVLDNGSQSIGDVRRNTTDADLSQIRFKKHYKQETWHPKNVAHKKRKSRHTEHRHKHSDRDSDYYYYLHHVHKDRHKHGKIKGFAPQFYLDEGEDDIVGHHRRRKERDPMESKLSRHSNESQAEYHKHKHLMDETHYRPHAKRMG